jgi:monoamine oxidase
LQFDRPYWYGPGPWPHPANGFVITDLGIQTLWDASRGQSDARGLLVDYTGGHRGAAYAPPTAYSTTDDFPQLQQYAQDCLQQLEAVFPGISAHYTGKAALSYPTSDPYLLGSYACWRVGQYTRFAGYEGVRPGTRSLCGRTLLTRVPGLYGRRSQRGRAGRS